MTTRAKARPRVPVAKSHRYAHVVIRRSHQPRSDIDRGAGLVSRFADDNGMIIVRDVADWFGISKAQLASTLGVRAAPATVQRNSSHAAAKMTQSRLREMLEIVGRITDWAGGPSQALAWYRAEPLPAFGGRTAESLVKTGKATAVRDYLDHVALGGFA